MLFAHSENEAAVGVGSVMCLGRHVMLRQVYHPAQTADWNLYRYVRLPCLSNFLNVNYVNIRLDTDIASNRSCLYAIFNHSQSTVMCFPGIEGYIWLESSVCPDKWSYLH